MRKNRYFILFIASWILSLLLYHQGNNAHFIFDFNMWALHYRELGWHGFLNCFTDQSMHYVGHILPFIIFSIVGYNNLAWTLALTALHSLNAVLIFVLIKKMLSLFDIKEAKQISAITVVLFLCSPLHTEVVVWASAVWYLQVMALVLGALIAVIDYMRGEDKGLKYYYLLLILAFFTWEISFCLPFIVLLFLLFIPQNRAGQGRLAVAIVLPSFACIVLYLLLNKLKAGTWVSHYGEEAHFRFSLGLLVNNLTGYILKLSAINAVYSYRLRDHLIHLLARLAFCQAIAFAGLVLALVISYRVRDRYKIKAAWLLFLISLAALVPVINIYGVYMKDIEQDRYLYIASPFFYASLVTLLFSVPSAFVRYALITAYAGLLLFYQHRFVNNWKIAGKVQNGLLNSFKWPDAERIIILCDADNVNGAYCLRSQPYSSFAEALLAHRNINVRNKVIEVLQFNMATANDSMSAERIDSVTIKTTFAQWGNWYSKLGIGASPSFETPDFKVSIDEWSHSFTTTMKKRYPGDVFIYQAKDHWEEVPM